MSSLSSLVLVIFSFFHFFSWGSRLNFLIISRKCGLLMLSILLFFAVGISCLIWSVLTGSCFKHVVPRYWSFWEALESLGCGACECKSLGPGLWRCHLASASWSENTWSPSFMLLMHGWGACVSPWAATPRNCELKYMILPCLATARWLFSLFYVWIHFTLFV